VVCACLPLMRPFVQKHLRKININERRETRSSVPKVKSLTSWSTWTSKGRSNRVTLTSMPDGGTEVELGTFQQLDESTTTEVPNRSFEPREAGNAGGTTLITPLDPLPRISRIENAEEGFNSQGLPIRRGEEIEELRSARTSRA
jgi:hypothetical protein